MTFLGFVFRNAPSFLAVAGAAAVFIKLVW